MLNGPHPHMYMYLYILYYDAVRSSKGRNVTFVSVGKSNVFNKQKVVLRSIDCVCVNLVRCSMQRVLNYRQKLIENTRLD